MKTGKKNVLLFFIKQVLKMYDSNMRSGKNNITI